ncbi:exosome non-catalytic core subunit rrp4 [Dissophora globulifera]|uniref:Exosome complex component RRP4 n=1 Tax=Dissophora globulifera TaxID=979702 RepID=A0A9P6RWJ4_9FUNG|nr:exosome non-catalytic core subunit rrp4 [Dissophora globulifera]KAG0327846.1 exosome non-catalytic core subunit rrp4 [Dissophora globulifera]
MSISFHSPAVRTTNDGVVRRRAVGHDMDLDDGLEGAAESAMKDPTLHVVTPGELITSDTAFMRGHGTYIEQEKVLSSVAGVVDRVNKLISVRPLHTRYTGEIGDVVVGRITEVAQKRWKVDLNARLDGILMLSSVNLPGGVQRRKQESDELQMRTFFMEGDLVVAEVQNFFADGAYSIHTRSLKYGKLRNGSFISVSPGLVQRSKSHFHSLSCGVDVILGLNGYIWVSAHVSQDLEEIDTEQVYSNKNKEDITPADRESIARIANCIRALAQNFVFINATIISFAYEASLQYPLKDMHKKEVMRDIAVEATTAVDNMRG